MSWCIRLSLVSTVSWLILLPFHNYAREFQSDNPVVVENKRGGTKSWWYGQNAAIPPIQGFTTKISYIHNESIKFKIDCADWISTFTLGIFRLGYYDNQGARSIANITVAAMQQPRCLFENESRMTDCSNWMANAEWMVPSDAVSGVFIALPVYTNSSSSTVYGTYIPFIVRQPPTKLGSDILFKTSDLTWVAYNKYGNWNLYRGNGSFLPTSRAFKASYNRPWQNRHLPPEGHFINFIFGVEFTMLFWLEKFGYDVSYCSCADIENMYHNNELIPLAAQRDPTVALPFKSILSIGHDEYWTPGMKEAHEHAREYGVHLLFLSGNEVFWRTMWDEDIKFASFTEKQQSNTPREASMLPDGTQTKVRLDSQRIIVCRKETLDNVPEVHSDSWTGTFRDPRHRTAEDESWLTGQNFIVNAHRKDSLRVTKSDSTMRFWRYASFASNNGTGVHFICPKHATGSDANISKSTKSSVLSPHSNIVHISAPGVLGYEWDEFPKYARPAGLFPLSTTRMKIEKNLLQNFGAAYGGSGIAIHRLSMYRHYSHPTLYTARESDLSDYSDLSDLSNMCKEIKSTSKVYSNNSCNSSISSSTTPLMCTFHKIDRLTSLVFGAGTVQWAWALESWHDGYSVPVDRDLTQAMLNVLADMKVFPGSFQENTPDPSCKLPLVKPTSSQDISPPTSKIYKVSINAQFSPHRSPLKTNVKEMKEMKEMKANNETMFILSVSGTATDIGGGQVAAVEISLDGGYTWFMATGRSHWRFVYKLEKMGGGRHRNTTRMQSRKRRNNIDIKDDAENLLRNAIFKTKTIYQPQQSEHSVKGLPGLIGNSRTVLILTRAVDDSGWIEEYDALSGLCAVSEHSSLLNANRSDSSGGVSGERIWMNARVQNMSVIRDNMVIFDW